MTKKYEISDEILIYRHCHNDIDYSHQFKNSAEGKGTKSTRIIDLNVEIINDFLCFFGFEPPVQTDKPFLVVGENYKINVEKFKNHIELIKKYFSASSFNMNSFEFPDLNLSQEFITGDITIALTDLDNGLPILQFGRHTPLFEIEEPTAEQLMFESFVFAGLFGGKLANGVEIPFVEIYVDKENKEIYHHINVENLEENIKEMDRIYRGVIDLQNTNENLNLLIDSNKVLAERIENLSNLHKEIQGNILSAGRKFEWECYANYLKKIDLLVISEEKHLIQIKSSSNELFKAIGEVLSYEKLLNETVRKIIVVQNYSEIENYIEQILEDLHIRVFEYTDFIQNINSIIN